MSTRQEDRLCGRRPCGSAGIIFFAVVFGFTSHKARDVASGVFTPTNEFKLDTWFRVGPIDFNKGVLYVVLAADHARDHVLRRAECSSARGASRPRSRCSTT